jgi:chromosomal replication initiation ATPase DnaA
MNNPEAIMQITANHFGTTVVMLKQKTRKQEIVEARQTAMALIKNNTGLSLKTIGFLFGKRDHSTVIHALNAVQDRLDTERSFRSKYYALVELLVQNEEIEPKNNITDEEIKSQINEELSHWIVEKKDEA